MKVIIISVFLVMASFVADAPYSYGASCCDQTFIIYGKTRGEYSVLLFDLFIGGECYDWSTYAFFFYPDTAKRFALNYAGSAQDWARDFILNNDHERVDTLKGDSGVYHLSENLSVSPPPADTSFPDKWRMVSTYDCCGARMWYKSCPVNCIDWPIFDGSEAQLVYYYKEGLYKNYSFKEVYYFRESGLVIILTYQPEIAPGMDRMDGIMMYLLRPYKKGE